ncbi:MAG: ribonuclease H-like domain-containing protein [Syntrophobacter sp.]
MLQNTFVHLPGVGIKTEQALWSAGICSWDTFRDPATCSLPFGKRKSEALREYLGQCGDHVSGSNPAFFARTLPTQLLWRLFPDFRHCTAYLDIETTGLGDPGDHITTAALYDGREIFHYVHGDNLDQFPQDLAKYKVLVTYNGSCFDLPFIRSSFGVPLEQVHIDLRFLLHNLGYRGGLKGCEKQLGLCRNELDGVDGYFAVLLWQEYKKKRNRGALETLLAYNIADAVNLETLMVKAYNLKLKETPFRELELEAPRPVSSTFMPDMKLIRELRDRWAVYL